MLYFAMADDPDAIGCFIVGGEVFFHEDRNQVLKDHIPVYLDNQSAVRRIARSSAWTTAAWSTTDKPRPAFSLRPVRSRSRASIRPPAPAEAPISGKIVRAARSEFIGSLATELAATTKYRRDHHHRISGWYRYTFWPETVANI